MLEVWILWLGVMSLAVLTLTRFQRATTASGQLVTGTGAVISGLIGLMLLAALVF